MDAVNRPAAKILPKHISGVATEAGFQRLGPNAGGGAERGTGGRWLGDVVVVRLVVGTAGVLVRRLR